MPSRITTTPALGFCHQTARRVALVLTIQHSSISVCFSVFFCHYLFMHSSRIFSQCSSHTNVSPSSTSRGWRSCPPHPQAQAWTRSVQHDESLCFAMISALHPSLRVSSHSLSFPRGTNLFSCCCLPPSSFYPLLSLFTPASLFSLRHAPHTHAALLIQDSMQAVCGLHSTPHAQDAAQTEPCAVTVPCQVDCQMVSWSVPL